MTPSPAAVNEQVPGEINLRRREAHVSRAALLLLVPLTLFVERAFRFALEKYYSIDEFQYAHAGWLVSEGQTPYRDFFQHYMPLLFQWLSVPFLVIGSDPTAMRALRIFAFPILLLIAYACYRINAPSDGRWALLAPLLLLSIKPFDERAIELRPDGLATALFFSAIALLSGPRPADRRRAFLAGALAGGSLLASQKALYYCLAFLVALGVDVLVNRRSKRFLLGDPARFCAGGAAVLLAFALYLTVTGAWSGWIEHSLSWSIYHQNHYPSFPYRRALAPVYYENQHLFVLAAGGLAVSLRRIAGAGRRAGSHPDLLLVLALGSTFASFALTTAPYIYCLVPFFPALCAFSARGVVSLCRRATTGRLAPVFGVLLAAIVGSELVQAYSRLSLVTTNTNEHQQKTLAKIGRLTRPDEPVFDNAGAAVTRPNVLFHYYGDRLHLELRARELESEAPDTMRRDGCMLVLWDQRFVRLPPRLLDFIAINYQTYDGDLRLWGRRYRVAPDRPLEDSFEAIRAGRYFVSPASALQDGRLLVDGRRILSPIFDLTRGMKRVEYSGNATEIHLLWLPADGIPYVPRPGLAPRFSIL